MIRPIGLMAVLGAASAAHAGPGSAMASAAANAHIYRPIQIQKMVDLDFGAVFASGQAGTVTVYPGWHDNDSQREVLDGVSEFLGDMHFHPAKFTVQGEPDFHFSVTVPGSVNLTGPGTPMQASPFLYNAAGSIPSSGTTDIRVGATLTVHANQTAGNYSGMFNVTVRYD